MLAERRKPVFSACVVSGWPEALVLSRASVFPLQLLRCPHVLLCILLSVQTASSSVCGREVCAPRGTLFGAQAPFLSYLTPSLHIDIWQNLKLEEAYDSQPAR